MPSLKQILRQTIKEKGYLPINEVYQIANDLNRKQSNAERRLRHSESPEIEAVRDKYQRVIGYRWLEEPKQLNLI